MIHFECSFEVKTRNDAINVLQEMISHIERDCYIGFFSSADGSWTSSGKEETEEDE